MSKSKSRLKEAALWLAILVGPFVSSLWTYEYWERIRDHLVWVMDSGAPTRGQNGMAFFLVVCVHVFLFVRFLILKGVFR